MSVHLRDGSPEIYWQGKENKNTQEELMGKGPGWKRETIF